MHLSIHRSEGLLAPSREKDADAAAAKVTPYSKSGAGFLGQFGIEIRSATTSLFSDTRQVT